MDVEEKINAVSRVLEQITEDTSVPRNIRRAAKEAADWLQDRKHTPGVRASSAVNILDEISEDPNMPVHTRTMIWSIVSELEVIQD